MSYIGRGSIVKYLPKQLQDFVNGLQFRPLRPHTMEPGPEASKTFDVPRIAGYRNPAPGSRPPPQIPRVKSVDEVYDIKYFSRDTRRAPRQGSIVIANKHLAPTPMLPEAEEDAPTGSTGKFGNPAVKTYDPTGLRSSMTATHDAYEAAILAAQPTQLVTYAWEVDQLAILDDCKAKGIPCVVFFVYSCLAAGLRPALATSGRCPPSPRRRAGELPRRPLQPRLCVCVR